MSILYHNNIASPDVQQILVVSLFTGKQLTCQAVKKIQGVALKTQTALIRGTNTIAQYLAHQHKIGGQKPQQIIQISQWFEYMNIQLYPVLSKIRENIFGTEKSKEIFTYALNQINRVFKVLDEHLSKRTFFVGDFLTVFDICLCVNIDSVMRLLITEEIRKKLRNITRWYCFVRQLKPIKSHIGRLVFCGKQPINLDFQEKKKQFIQEKAQKVSNQKQQQTKGQLIINSEKEVRMQSNQNGFILQDFKRKIVNSQLDKRKQLLTQFLNVFDKKNWSIWKIHYEKDVNQGKADYLTNNLAGGLLNKLEGINKKAFGTWGVYGVQGDYEIRGVMLWQGIQICDQWKHHPAFNYHIFTKLDSANEQHRNIIFDYWLKQSKAQGLPLYNSKFVV